MKQVYEKQPRILQMTLDRVWLYRWIGLVHILKDQKKGLRIIWKIKSQIIIKFCIFDVFKDPFVLVVFVIL